MPTRIVLIGMSVWACRPRGTAAAQENAMRRLDLEHVPVAVWLLARGPGHVVLDATAGRQIVFGEGGR